MSSRCPNRKVTPPRILTHEEQLLTTLILETRTLRNTLEAQAKQSDSQRRTAIAQIHNLQVEVQELRSQIHQVTKLFLQLVHEPQAQNYAEATVRDYFQTRIDSKTRK